MLTAKLLVTHSRDDIMRKCTQHEHECPGACKHFKLSSVYRSTIKSLEVKCYPIMQYDLDVITTPLSQHSL